MEDNVPVDRIIEQLSEFTFDIIDKRKKELYGIRMLVYSAKTGKKITDRTFTAPNEQSLMLKVNFHVAKKRMFRQYTPSKVKLRFMTTNRNMPPLWFLQKLVEEGKKEGKEIVLEEEKDKISVSNGVVN